MELCQIYFRRDMHCKSGNIIEKITDHLLNVLIKNLNTQIYSKFKPLKKDL